MISQQQTPFRFGPQDTLRSHAQQHRSLASVVQIVPNEEDSSSTLVDPDGAELTGAICECPSGSVTVLTNSTASATRIAAFLSQDPISLETHLTVYDHEESVSSPIVATLPEAGTHDRYVRALEWFLDSFTVTDTDTAVDRSTFEERYRLWTQNVFGSQSPNRTWIGRTIAGEPRIEYTTETIEGIRWSKQVE